MTLFASVRLTRQLNATTRQGIDTATGADRRRPPCWVPTSPITSWIPRAWRSGPDARPPSWTTPGRSIAGPRTAGLAAGAAGPRAARGPARSRRSESGRAGGRIRGARADRRATWPWFRSGSDLPCSGGSTEPSTGRSPAHHVRGGAGAERDHPERGPHAGPSRRRGRPATGRRPDLGPAPGYPPRQRAAAERAARLLAGLPNRAGSRRGQSQLVRGRDPPTGTGGGPRRRSRRFGRRGQRPVADHFTLSRVPLPGDWRWSRQPPISAATFWPDSGLGRKACVDRGHAARRPAGHPAPARCAGQHHRAPHDGAHPVDRHRSGAAGRARSRRFRRTRNAPCTCCSPGAARSCGSCWSPPQPVAPETIDYYLGLLPDPGGARRAAVRLSPSTTGAPRPLAAKLLDRPDVIQRLREAIGDPHAAFIAPFNVGPPERDLALAARACRCTARTSASTPTAPSPAAGELFAEEQVAHPAGAENIAGLDDLVAALIADARRQPCARLGGRQARRQCLRHRQRRGRADRPARAGRPRARTPPSAPCCTTTSTPTTCAGSRPIPGIVEEMVLGEEVDSPSVQLRILAGGTDGLVCTHDQLLGGDNGQAFVGCRFPAGEEYAPLIVAEAEKVRLRLAAEGVVGRFGIDFVVARRGRRLAPVRGRDQPARGRHEPPVRHPLPAHRRQVRPDRSALPHRPGRAALLRGHRRPGAPERARRRHRTASWPRPTTAGSALGSRATDRGRLAHAGRARTAGSGRGHRHRRRPRPRPGLFDRCGALLRDLGTTSKRTSRAQ